MENPDGTLTVQKIQPKRHISISQLNKLSQCGESYRRQYVLKQRQKASLSMIVGSAVDKSVTLNLDRKIMSGELMSVDEVREIAYQDFNTRLHEELDGEGIMFKKSELEDGKQESIKEAEAKTIRLATMHAQIVAPKLSPVYVQRPLSIELPGYPFDLGGVIDIQELDAVRDTKTKDKTPPEDAAFQEDQLTLYALLVMVCDGTIPQKLVLDCLIDTKIPKYVARESTRVEEDFNPLLARIEAAYQALESGIFVPARESDWWCGEYSCSFWSSCRYVKRSRRPAA